MRQFVRITLGAAAAATLGACVVVPAHRMPPPAYRVEYRSAPPPPEARVEVRFHDRQREIAREYYRDEYRHGRRERHQRDWDRGRGRGRGCPPGLAMRDDRCARAWERGRRLPRDVEVRAVPRDLAVQIGPAPRGYRYAEVAGDILMIAVGTGIVVDAIDNLNQ